MQIANSILHTVSIHYKVAAIWQNEDLDGVSYHQIESADSTTIDCIVKDFVSLLNDAQKRALIADPENFGHWLCLESMGHGAGFYDSTDPVVSSISELFEYNNKFDIIDQICLEDDLLCIDFTQKRGD